MNATTPDRWARLTRKGEPGRFRVAVSHGEGDTVFYAVDSAAPQDEQPAVVRSWRMSECRGGASARWLADDFCARHNAR